MDARSLATLAPLCPAFSAKVEAAAAVLEPDGIFMCVYSGLRTGAEQDALYESSRPPNSGPWKTNAKAGQSNHQYGFAADIVPYMPNSTALNWNVASPDFQAMVAALKGQGLIYGGDWIHAKDNDHFQLDGFPVTPSAEMQTVFHSAPDAYKTLWPVSA